ncbi:hypothetical protein TEK04_01305 [Klenkia sp. LSe6-5]|uniref:Uncharacterized protein n=1 Tax=Klenkia sesuvii TaxID=3103137 RepID=A0ABU8DQM7_9ACTN
MRLTTPVKTVVAGSAALALLTACSGGSDDTAATSSATSTSAAPSSAEQSSGDLDADTAAFCSDTTSAFADLESAFSSAGDDPTAIPTLLAQASERLQGIEPPAEISDAWTRFTGALDTAATAVQGVDLTTPEGQQQFATAFGALQTTAAQDQTELQDYLSSTCGIDAAEPSATATS